ncbi:MAG: alpha/beta hydrolase [Armatimonadota bacterium]|nr:alpha/beta hydrolase [Armatimonadota bacterium]
MTNYRRLITIVLAFALCAGAAYAVDVSGQKKFLNDVEYGKAAGKPLLLDLVLPKESANTFRPVVVWIHGGGWRAGNKSNNMAAWLADHGYVVASINYRLSNEAKFPAQIYDCKAAIRFLRAHSKQYRIDPYRIGVWGSSAGGHLSALLGTSGGLKELEGDSGSPGYSSRVQAVCDFFGPADLTVLGGARISRNPIVQLLGGPVSANMQLAKLASPVTHITYDDPPILIFHGEDDNLVPIKQSEIFYKALKNAGVDATFVRVKNGGHGFPPTGTEPTLEQIKSTVLRFFDKHLKPTALKR